MKMGGTIGVPHVHTPSMAILQLAGLAGLAGERTRGPSTSGLENIGVAEFADHHLSGEFVAGRTEKRSYLSWLIVGL